MSFDHLNSIELDVSLRQSRANSILGIICCALGVTPHQLFAWASKYGLGTKELDRNDGYVGPTVIYKCLIPELPLNTVFRRNYCAIPLYLSSYSFSTYPLATAVSATSRSISPCT